MYTTRLPGVIIGAGYTQKDTQPEMVVRKWLFAHGFRYKQKTSY